MQQEILKIEPAYKRLLMKLESQGFKIDHVDLLNDRCYLLATGSLYGDPYNLLITYKREVFKHFGKMFLKNSKIEGDTINCDSLKIAVQNNVKTIFVVFANARAYSISLEDFLNNSEKWRNREGKEVRSVALFKYKFEFEV